MLFALLRLAPSSSEGRDDATVSQVSTRLVFGLAMKCWHDVGGH